MQLNRFMWEDIEKGFLEKTKKNQNRKCLKFENVISVSSKNIKQGKEDRFRRFFNK